MKEDKRIGVQGEGSKTPDADVQNAATTDSTDYQADDYLSRDELRVLIAGQDRNISAQAEVIKASQARIRDLQDALDAANELIERERKAHKMAALDYFDLVSQLPQDSNGAYIGLDDIVEYHGKRYLVVAISHKGKVVIRPESETEGKGGRWLDDTSKVTFTEGGPQTHDAIVARLRAAGYVPAEEAQQCACHGEGAPDSTLWEDAEFWRQQYGKSQLEHMQLTSEYSDACCEIDSLKARLEDAERAGEAIENARSLAVGLENEAARLKAEVADLRISPHDAEAERNLAAAAWDMVLNAADAVARLLGTFVCGSTVSERDAMALATLADVLENHATSSRRLMGARDAFDFAHKGADHGQD